MNSVGLSAAKENLDPREHPRRATHGLRSRGWPAAGHCAWRHRRPELIALSVPSNSRPAAHLSVTSTVMPAGTSQDLVAAAKNRRRRGPVPATRRACRPAATIWPGFTSRCPPCRRTAHESPFRDHRLHVIDGRLASRRTSTRRHRVRLSKSRCVERDLRRSDRLSPVRRPPRGMKLCFFRQDRA